ncbi:uncharacterized protein [Lepeophtheirus salmonis]|uniref:uncharacterized protein n=1 Tax=Lepeophtheirus salmonis TaxID=72036 RepID=UPI001AE7E122|nr:uncharacterized protein LOC121124440 [Lepeophtheirus salmonis]
MKTIGILSVLLFIVCVSSFPQNRDSPVSYSKQPDGFFQYVNVPAPNEYEFGWNRGNAKDYISRYEQSKNNKFRSRVRWGNENAGYGEHYYEYNHVQEPTYEEPIYQEESVPVYSVPTYVPTSS